METKTRYKNGNGFIDQSQLFDDLAIHFEDGLRDENLLDGLKAELFKRHKDLTGDFTEIYALVNSQPNKHFCNTHRLLTMVSKPQSMETGVYRTRDKEQAIEDLKWHKEETGDHIELKKLTIQDVDVDLE